MTNKTIILKGVILVYYSSVSDIKMTTDKAKIELRACSLHSGSFIYILFNILRGKADYRVIRESDP